MGEIVHRLLPPESDQAQNTTRRRLLLTASGLASNFPDLDLIFVKLLPKPLGYLLHHRGHTHTLLFLIPQALLILLALWLLWPAARRLFSSSSRTRLGVAITVPLGLCLHLGMDAFNSYGIHPFYPLNPDWFYGDMVFIVEPFFWIAFGLPLLATINRTYLRWLGIALLLAAPVYFTLKGFFHFGSLAVLFAAAFGLYNLGRRRSFASVVLGCVLVLSFLIAEGIGSMVARQTVTANIPNTVLDVALHSYPTNPLCWMYVSIAKDEANQKYELRRGKVSVWPSALKVDECPNALIEIRSVDSTALATAEVVSGDLSHFRSLAKSDCRFNAWLRFARMPIVDAAEARDFRFSANGRPDFSSLHLRESRNCPEGIPLWGQPRRDLF